MAAAGALRNSWLEGLINPADCKEETICPAPNDRLDLPVWRGSADGRKTQTRRPWRREGGETALHVDTPTRCCVERDDSDSRRPVDRVIPPMVWRGRAESKSARKLSPKVPVCCTGIATTRPFGARPLAGGRAGVAVVCAPPTSASSRPTTPSDVSACALNSSLAAALSSAVAAVAWVTFSICATACDT